MLQKRPILRPVLPVHVVLRFSLRIGLDVRRARQSALQCRVGEVSLGKYLSWCMVDLQRLQARQNQGSAHVVPFGCTLQLV